MRYFCIDIGGTAIKYALLEEETMELSACSETPTPAGGEQIVAQLEQIVRELWAYAPEVKTVCVSCSGIIDSAGGYVLEANEALMPHFTGTRIADLLQKRLGVQAHVENDVNCAALAEHYQGAAKGAKSSVTLTVGTGIGGAVILDGKLLTGPSFSAGEVGYLHMEGGSFEELAATSALVAAVAARTGEAAGTLNGRMVFARALGGDAVCREEIARMCDVLAKGIANICYVVNPEAVVIGGGICAQRAYLEPLLKEGLRRYLIAPILQKTTLHFAACGNQAGMIGAYYAWKCSREKLEWHSS